ncbi:NAD(P)/FAD-dependent oxidoreductase (plasmid) [Roseinatronobacter sp. S2]|nr:NAD(P)/FAD-dependent oxidoreductase [Roseinatronobacter sp. S2]
MAAAAGWKVAIVDQLPYGGTCALRGCDPKKMLVSVTEGVEQAQAMAGKGLVAAPRVDWAEMMAFKRTFTDAMPGRIEAGHDKAGIATLHGTARFTAPDTVEIDGVAHRARHFHIATGARPASLGIPGEVHLITSTDFLELPECPRRIAFVGGGYIAMEFAHIAARSGAEAVTVLQRGARILPNFDPDLTEILAEATKALGVTVHTGAEVSGIARDGDAFRVHFDTPDGPQDILCDRVVHAAGRMPNIDTLNLDAAGVQAGARGITVSAAMRTTNSAIFAAGDCAYSGPNLTPVSANEARVAAKNLLAGQDAREITYPPIPSTVFTLPPMASVGLSEAAAKEEGREVDVHFARTEDWYSSLRVGAKASGYKVLVERKTGLILGAHLIGPGAEEQINIFAMAMGAGLTANQIKAAIFAYPSYASDLGSMV